MQFLKDFFSASPSNLDFYESLLSGSCSRRDLLNYLGFSFGLVNDSFLK